jgi:hypothetical protein
MRRVITVAVLIVFLLSSCVTHTNVTIDTDPEGADVYVDGRPIGESPADQRLSNAIWNSPRVRVEMDGYETINSEVRKELKGVNLAIGLLLWWPALLWVHGPVENQFFNLQPASEAAAARAAEAAEEASRDDEPAETAEASEAPEAYEPEADEVQRQTMVEIERTLREGTEVRLGLVVRDASAEQGGGGGRSEQAIVTRLLQRFGRYDDFHLVDRSETEAIVEELEFQMTGLVDEDQLAEYGRLSGATHLLIVEYVRDEQASVLIVEDRRRLLRVQTGTAVAADATVTTLIWDTDTGQYEVVSRKHNGRPVRMEDGRLYAVED